MGVLRMDSGESLLLSHLHSGLLGFGYVGTSVFAIVDTLVGPAFLSGKLFDDLILAENNINIPS